MSDGIKLKPCPFCGGKANEDAGGTSEFYGHDHQNYWIECETCGARVEVDTCQDKDGKVSPGFDVPCSCCHDTQAMCIAKWNRRAEVK